MCRRSRILDRRHIVSWARVWYDACGRRTGIPSGGKNETTGTTETTGTDGTNATIAVRVEVGAFDEKSSKVKKVYVSLVDDNGVHVLDFERELSHVPQMSQLSQMSRSMSVTGTVANAHLWSAEDPYLYTLAVALVDARRDRAHGGSRRRSFGSLWFGEIVRVSASH